MDTFRHVADGVVIESDLIVCSIEEWEGSDKAGNEEWSVLRLGFEVRALRIRGIPAILGGIAASTANLRRPPID